MSPTEKKTPFGTGVSSFGQGYGLGMMLDPWLLLVAVGLLATSAFVIHGATAGDIPGSPDYYVVRQVAYGISGLILMLLLSRVDYSRLKEFKVGIYSVMIFTIVLVLGVGGATRGSRRWIDLPFFNFQPSELGKVLLILSLAGFILAMSRKLNQPKATLKILGLGLFPALLVLLQPDLGTAMVFAVITVTLLYLAGTRWTHLAIIAAALVALTVLVLVLLPKAGVTVLKDYQVQRLTAFLHPEEELSESAYQQNQALIALGSGRHTGRGVEEATQTRLDFLPEHHTDFIFAVIGESYGFVGAGIVLSLYALLIWRGLRILTTAKDMYGVLVAGGIVAMLMFQVFINIGMNTGIMPITGVPLPLMSYGGSSVIVTFIAIGLLQSIYARSRERVPGQVSVVPT